KKIIYFRKTCLRKILPGEGRARTAIRALWSLGRWQCDTRAVLKATAPFLRGDWEELAQLASLMPAWMWNEIRFIPRIERAVMFAGGIAVRGPLWYVSL